MRLVYNSNSTMHLPALMQIRVARETGWDGVFLRAEHLRRYLAQGFDAASLRDALDGLGPVNLGALADVERWRPDERAAMLREAEALTELAVERRGVVRAAPDRAGRAGRLVQRPGAELPPAELRRVTASAIRAVADLGAPHGLRYYLEPVAWTPMSTLAQAVEAIDEAERDNVGLVLDLWHLWQRGTTPDEVARLDRRYHLGRRLRRFARPGRPPGARSALALRLAGGGGHPAPASGSTRSVRPASTAGGTTSCTARSTGKSADPFADRRRAPRGPPGAAAGRPPVG